MPLRSEPTRNSRMSVPSKVMVPPVASRRRGSSSTSVDLPAPERPTSAVNEPAGIFAETPMSTSLPAESSLPVAS